MNSLLASPKITIPLSDQGYDWYPLIEYGILHDHFDGFVLNQPYDLDESMEAISNSGLNAWTNTINAQYCYCKDEDNVEGIGVHIAPGYSVSTHGSKNNSIMLVVNGLLKIGDLFLVNRFRLNDPALKNDPYFHGDTGEWLYGYFDESYAVLSLSDKVDLFMGRMNRNFGALNDYGLILSDNPYAFDHFGFTATGNRLKYSFYTTRLNDILGEDSQGGTMPSDTLMQTKRYWAIQRLDWKIRENLQIALSEATVYGGPDQNWVASYMNPVQFFYAAQRNQSVQLNSMWQINVFWKPKQGLGFYVDLFADDLIINNEEVSDRDRHPDRLGFLLKASITDLFISESLTSVRYVCIWNDTYTSFRTFENYAYFNKGIGFPINSYEGVKLNWNYLGSPPVLIQSSLELWQHGDINLHQVFDGEIKEFPVSPVIYGITTEFEISTPYWHQFEFEFTFINRLTTLAKKNFFNNCNSSNEIQIKLLYQFSFIF
ncbi:MAG: hypothetical protein HQ521_20260 [Bacteroidetes bacterium]|nr:hypothetical protein [Bacteroidota bacterium]